MLISICIRILYAYAYSMHEFKNVRFEHETGEFVSCLTDY